MAGLPVRPQLIYVPFLFYSRFCAGARRFSTILAGWTAKEWPRRRLVFGRAGADLDFSSPGVIYRRSFQMVFQPSAQIS
jgi:hypothetical protein